MSFEGGVKKQAYYNYICQSLTILFIGNPYYPRDTSSIYFSLLRGK